MIYLHILGSGKSQSEKANSKGHLFERLMSDVLKYLKINVTHMNKSENGLEIDIEGETIVGKVKVFAECKAQEDLLNGTDIQKFGFKFLDKKSENPDIRGLLFTLSPLNTKAQEVWDQKLISKHPDQVECYFQKQIIELLINHYHLASPNVIQQKAEKDYNRACGDTQILCLEGDNKVPILFWAQLLMSSDGTEPNLVVLYNAEGCLIREKSTITKLLSLKPDLATTKLTCLNNIEDLSSKLPELGEINSTRTVVRVRKSSDWFDFRFPSAPQFFVGRNIQRNELAKFVKDVKEGRTSVRGVLISGKSGIGKSSLALKAQQELRNEKVILLPIDSRLCDDVSFLFDIVNELLFELRQIPELRDFLNSIYVKGLDSLIETLTEIHNFISQRDYLAVLFFDQFEKVFEYPEITRALRTLFLRITERQLSILFGFAWKSDLWSLAEGFPHNERDDIVREAYPVKRLGQFDQDETNEILKQLTIEWGRKLNSQLYHQLATFSRGLPWLLKKVCAHVLDQKSHGVSENELIETNLKLQDLFEADLAGLDDEERSLLRTIAPLLPTTLRRLSESFEISNIDQSLHRFIDKRILVKITEDVGDSYANVKYDAYSDIFREFLITGAVPIEDAYYFYTYPSGAFKFFDKVKRLTSLSIDQEMKETGKQIGSIYNLSRDLRNLGFVNVSNKVFTVEDDVKNLSNEEILLFLQGQLKRNRVISLTLAELNNNGTVSSERIADLLKELFPSIRAKEKTWEFYSKTTAKWLHEAKLALYNSKDNNLYQIDNEDIFARLVDRRSLSLTGLRLPMCFRNAIIECLEAIKSFGDGKSNISQLKQWLNKSQFSIEKALSDNLNLIFLSLDEDKGVYCITPLGIQFIESAGTQRQQLFREQCLKIEGFKRFISYVDASGKNGISSRKAAEMLIREMQLDFADATIEKLGNMLANWAEYAGILTRLGKLCFMKNYISHQLRLF